MEGQIEIWLQRCYSGRKQAKQSLIHFFTRQIHDNSRLIQITNAYLFI